VVKWIIYALIALLVLYVLLRALWAFLKHLAHFTTWARNLLAALRNLWQSLFAWLPRRSSAKEGAEEAAAARPLRPFSWYRDPFLTGSAERRSPQELVSYSFDALQAWAREVHLERLPGETPLEFVARLGQEVPALEADAQRLAGLYVQAAYAAADSRRPPCRPCGSSGGSWRRSWNGRCRRGWAVGENKRAAGGGAGQSPHRVAAPRKSVPIRKVVAASRRGVAQKVPPKSSHRIRPTSRIAPMSPIGLA